MRIETIGSATLYLGDCMEVLPTLGEVDAVITDPPYGIDVGSMGMGRGKKATGFTSFEWDKSPPAPALIDAIRGKAAICIIWGGNYFHLPPTPCWLAWDKVQEFSGADMELAWTSMRKPTKAFRMSRIDAHQNTGERKEHPTQKPLTLMKWCIDQAGVPEMILDPFMGSGSTGVAAIQMGREFIGIEREERYFDIACRRIEQAVKTPALFNSYSKDSDSYSKMENGSLFDDGKPLISLENLAEWKDQNAQQV